MVTIFASKMTAYLNRIDTCFNSDSQWLVSLFPPLSPSFFHSLFICLFIYLFIYLFIFSFVDSYIFFTCLLIGRWVFSFIYLITQRFYANSSFILIFIFFKVIGMNRINSHYLRKLHLEISIMKVILAVNTLIIPIIADSITSSLPERIV